MAKTKQAGQARTPEAIRATQERRRSGAAGSHDSRPRRARTRQAARRESLRDWA